MKFARFLVSHLLPPSPNLPALVLHLCLKRHGNATLQTNQSFEKRLPASHSDSMVTMIDGESRCNRQSVFSPRCIDFAVAVATSHSDVIHLLPLFVFVFSAFLSFDFLGFVISLFFIFAAFFSLLWPPCLRWARPPFPHFLRPRPFNNIPISYFSILLLPVSLPFKRIGCPR
jgi:hypothetical protein